MPMKARYTVIDGELVAEKRNSVRSLYVPDSLGTTRALLNNAQTQTDTFVAWPYGETIHLTGINPTPFIFVGTQGYYQDSDSKTHIGLRDLAQTIARWITEDPIGMMYPAHSRYEYSANCPATDYDRSGLKSGGGPYHPPPGVRPGCRPGDSCAVIAAKMWLIQKILNSHIGWQFRGGGGDHRQDIINWSFAWVKCQAMLIKNCSGYDPCWRPWPVPVPAPIKPPVLPYIGWGLIIGGVIACIIFWEVCVGVAAGGAVVALEAAPA